MYKRYCELKGVPVQWTHHDWNEAIGYAHVDPYDPKVNKEDCCEENSED
jgi:hypothetical protein